MDSLFGLLAATTATTAVDIAGRTAKAAATPFDMMLKAASAKAEDAEKQSAEESPLSERVKEKLQALLSSIGVQSGDRLRIEIDHVTGQLRVGDEHPRAAEIEQLLNADSTLGTELTELAAVDGVYDIAPFYDTTELEVEVGQEGAAPTITWR